MENEKEGSCRPVAGKWLAQLAIRLLLRLAASFALTFGLVWAACRLAGAAWTSRRVLSVAGCAWIALRCLNVIWYTTARPWREKSRLVRALDVAASVGFVVSAFYLLRYIFG